MILLGRIHTADNEGMLGESGNLKKKKTNNTFLGMKFIHVLDLCLSLLSLFVSPNFQHDCRFQRENYFWEVGNIHINTLLRA